MSDASGDELELAYLEVDRLVIANGGKAVRLFDQNGFVAEFATAATVSPGDVITFPTVVLTTV